MSKAAELANLIGNINAGGGGVNRNVIINGAMNVAQRGTSFTGLGGSTGAVYTLDRFHTFDGATAGRATVTQDSSAPSGFANSLKLACTTADTSIAAGEIFVLAQRIEGQNLQAFAKGTSDAKPFSLSFYAKANASKTYVAELFDIDNSRHVGKTFTVGTDWARHEITFPADTTGAFGDDNGRSLDVSIWLHGGSTFTGGTLGTTWQAEDADDRAAGIGSFFSSTNNTFFITGLQLEVGQNPTSFESESFDVTLQKCHRYFFKNSSTIIRSTVLRPDNIRNFDIGFPTMRASATATVTYSDDGTGVSIASQAVSADRYAANTAASSTSNADPRFTAFQVDAEL